MNAALTRLRSVEGAALALTVLAYLLRAFRKSAVFGSSDAADLPAAIDRLVCRPGNTLTDLKTMALYRLGGVESVLIYLHVALYRLLHLHVTETTWMGLTLVVGTANVYLAFLLCRELAGPLGGLFAAALVAVCPLDIIQSRHLGAPWQYEEFCQIGLSYLLLTLPRAKSRARRFAFHLLLALYFWTGNQMLGIFPVLTYGAIAVVLERDRSEGVPSFLRRCFGGWSTLVPIASMALLCYATFVLHKGHLFHALYQKRHVLGFYVGHWFEDIHNDIGPGATWFGVAALIVGAVSERRLFSTKRVTTVLFICYAGPFWFLIPPGGTLTRGYITYGVTALLLCLPLGMIFAGARKAAQIAFPGIAVLMLLGSSGQSAFRLYSDPLFQVYGFQGSFTPNNGVKTAAAWVRNRPEGHGKVFSDAWGGGGLEPQLMWMYFRMPYYGISDAVSATTPYELYKSSAASIDYLVVLPQNRRLVTHYFGTAFSESLRIVDGDRGETLLVYSRGKAAKPTTIDVRDGDADYESKYSLLCGK